ncbi:MAG: DNA cytosine methyltransferase, partial [Clostridiales bacterium]|nr:DNA cytosine methyltransferase [Clostridiales bacterium]
GGAQSRLDGMVNGFPVEMDGHKLWKREPEGIPRITEETENRAARLKTLGNAVCPPQVFPILKCIADIETSACKENCVFGELC